MAKGTELERKQRVVKDAERTVVSFAEQRAAMEQDLLLVNGQIAERRRFLGERVLKGGDLKKLTGEIAELEAKRGGLTAALKEAEELLQTAQTAVTETQRDVLLAEMNDKLDQLAELGRGLGPIADQLAEKGREARSLVSAALEAGSEAAKLTRDPSERVRIDNQLNGLRGTPIAWNRPVVALQTLARVYGG